MLQRYQFLQTGILPCNENGESASALKRCASPHETKPSQA